ncbi:unnamed protein product, partial [Adineta steineri]
FKAMDKWHEKNPSVNSLDLDGVQQKNARQSSVGDEGTNKFSVRISTQFYP